MSHMTLQPAFTSGELSPSLCARVDLAKFQQGCRLLKNFYVQPHGGAVKRPGFLWLGELPGEAALLEFVFNSEQAYALCFGEKWLRVAMPEGFVLGEDGKPYQIATPYTLAQAKTLCGAQSADVLYLTCQGIVPHTLLRFGHAEWKLVPMVFTPPIAPPEWDSKTVTSNWSEYPLLYSSGAAYYRYTTNAGEWNSGTSYEPINQALYGKVDKSSSTYVPNINFVNGARKSDGSSSAAQLVTPYTYYITAVDKDNKESKAGPVAAVTGPASNAWQSGDYIVLRWKPVEGAEEYRIYKAEFGGRPGYVGCTGDVTWQDYNSRPIFSDGPPKWDNPFPDGDYPAVCGFFEQRLVFASTPKRPMTLWLSRSADYTNFSASTPIKADDALELTIAGQTVSGIQWLVALRSLVLGSSNVEWEVGSSDGAFTAKTAKVSPQSYRGSAALRALVVGNAILHVTRSGREVRDLKYDYGADSYNGVDLGILAAHLFEGRRLVSWAFQPAPSGVVWAVRDDGVLLGLTYQREHEVGAWHQHHTQGKFTAVACVPSGQDDAVFAVVQRDGVYHLERMADVWTGGESTANCVFADAAVQYSGDPVQTLAGLEHLEGKEVTVLAGGAVQAPRTVENGSITLDAAASAVTVGLGYFADLQTMPVEVVGQSGTSVGRKKQINAVTVQFQDTVTAKVGLDFGQLETVKWRTTEPFGSPERPYSGTHRVVVPSTAETSTSVCVRSDAPLPMTVLAITPEVDVK